MRAEERQARALLLRGTIANLQRSRRSHDFVLTQVNQQQIGAVAIGATALGMAAAGIGLVGMASNADEDADWVEFEVDGKKMQGWLWLFPMRNGDQVDVVVEEMGHDRYRVYSVRRVSDGIVATYPHATAGRRAHYRNMAKIMLWTFFVLYGIFAIGTLLRGITSGDIYAYALVVAATGVAGLAMFSIIFYRVSRKLMGFVCLAELIFRTYGWSDVEQIDLRKTSREYRGANTLSNYGKQYFRYELPIGSKI